MNQEPCSFFQEQPRFFINDYLIGLIFSTIDGGRSRVHAAVHTWLDNIVERAVPQDPQSHDAQRILPDNLSLVVNGTIWDMVPTTVPSSEAVQSQSYELDDLLGLLLSASTDSQQERAAASLPTSEASKRLAAALLPALCTPYVNGFDVVACLACEMDERCITLWPVLFAICLRLLV